MTDPQTSPAPIVRTATLARPPAEAFAVFTQEIGAWWPLPTHGIFGDKAGGVRFVDQQLVEIATDGSQVVWADVLEWDDPNRLVLAWHPGRADGPASRVEVTFAADGDGTRVQIRHDDWENFGREGMLNRRSYVGPSAWGFVLDHLADGAEHRADAADLTTLAAAYDQFFLEAEAGGFASPTDDGWDAQQVVAHVALNDVAMTAVAQRLIHQDEPSFENHTCQQLAHLDAVIAACGDMPGLIAYGRSCAQVAMAAVRRLDPEQRAHLVPCRFEHDGHVVMEEPRPWEAIAVDIQAGMHLPAHIGQLQDLRP